MSGTMPSEILFYAILACCTRIAPFSTWEKITDPTNFLDRGRVTYVFQSELFLFSLTKNKFTVLPNLELIGSVSKKDPISPKCVYAYYMIVSFLSVFEKKRKIPKTG